MNTNSNNASSSSTKDASFAEAAKKNAAPTKAPTWYTSTPAKAVGVVVVVAAVAAGAYYGWKAYNASGAEATPAA